MTKEKKKLKIDMSWMYSNTKKIKVKLFCYLKVHWLKTGFF